MRSEITKCRVCGATPLVGYYGLCADCHEATLRFWASRAQRAARQKENSEREAKADELRNRPAEPRPDADGAGEGVEKAKHVRKTASRRGGKSGGKKSRKRV